MQGPNVLSCVPSVLKVRANKEQEPYCSVYIRMHESYAKGRKGERRHTFIHVLMGSMLSFHQEEIIKEAKLYTLDL